MHCLKGHNDILFVGATDNERYDLPGFINQNILEYRR
jgi:hypothetical protein